MASNGLNKKALKGKCRMCNRVRNTGSQVKAVGEVRHGYATGHIWECFDTIECDTAIDKKLNSNSVNEYQKDAIRQNVERGRYKEYKIIG